MPLFQYRALQTDGILAEGQLEAAGRQEAFNQMAGLGLRPVSLDEQAKAKESLLPSSLTCSEARACSATPRCCQ